jgi:hypothetical protein
VELAGREEHLAAGSIPRFQQEGGWLCAFSPRRPSDATTTFGYQLSLLYSLGSKSPVFPLQNGGNRVSGSMVRTPIERTCPCWVKWGLWPLLWQGHPWPVTPGGTPTGGEILRKYADSRIRRRRIRRTWRTIRPTHRPAAGACGRYPPEGPDPRLMAEWCETLAHRLVPELVRLTDSC